MQKALWIQNIWKGVNEAGKKCPNGKWNWVKNVPASCCRMREIKLDTIIENPTFSQRFPPWHNSLLPLSKSSLLPLVTPLTAFRELTGHCPSYFWALGISSFSLKYCLILTSPMAHRLHYSYCYLLLHIYLTLVMHSNGFLLFVLFHILAIISHWIEFTHWSGDVSSNISTVFVHLATSLLPDDYCGAS